MRPQIKVIRITYWKFVCSLMSSTGVNIECLLTIPNKTAVSGLLLYTVPENIKTKAGMKNVL